MFIQYCAFIKLVGIFHPVRLFHTVLLFDSVEYMPIISAVGLFCFDKFEDNQNEKVFNIFPNVMVN